MFGGVNRADAIQADPLGRDHLGEGWEGVKPVAAGDIGDRRAVQIARGGGERRVEIAVRIQPQQEQRAVGPRGKGRGPGHRAQRQRMVAAQDHRQAARRQRIIDLVTQGLRPAQHLRQGMHRRVGTGGSAQFRQGDIAPILHDMPQVADRRAKSGDAVGCRPHDATGPALAVVDRGADQDDFGHEKLLAVVFPTCGRF